ncbi:nucleotidyltransferase family protein [Haloarcula sp. GH36]|uniref:nucleotidyltransferase family protein n=1 Tax=Haloarcula montana TaxID=3111776 RepID=UPI002D798DF2|nr:nucleotidyltransferase family protein [Haloarcula sp. GH36]
MTGTPTGAPDQETHPTVHGVVLAAGTSSRYGDSNKLLEAVDGEPLVGHAVRTLSASSVDGVTVVVGYEAARVREAIADLGADIRVNQAFEAGQSTSVAAGVEATRERGADAVVFALGDMPDVAVQSIDALLRAYRCGDGDALAAAYDGTRGNPVLFDRRFFDALSNIDGDVGGREILLNDPDAAMIETGDPGVLRDIDRPADLDGRHTDR